MSKIYCIGDIHGAAKALKQCLSLVNFDYENDTLISLGDICDGWSQTKECIDILMTIKNLILIRGNHDQWFLDWVDGKFKVNNYGCQQDFLNWMNHGGWETVKSLAGEDIMPLSNDDLNFNHRASVKIDKKYIDFLKSAKLQYRLGDNFFCHAGVDISAEENEQNDYFLLWDRDMVNLAYRQQNEPYLKSKFAAEWIKNTMFWVGHTPTISFDGNFKTPQSWANINLVDTGAAFTGRVTIMDLETKTFWQSDRCMELYPDEKGRNKKAYAR